MSTAVRVLSYLRTYWHLELIVILCLLGVTVLNIIVPLTVLYEGDV